MQCWLQFDVFFFRFLKNFDVQLRSGPQWYELRVDTPGEEIFQGFDV